MLLQQGGCFALLLLPLLCCMVGTMSTMDRVVATSAVVVKTMENTNNRYVENIKWYPYYEHNGNDGQEQLPRILQAGSYGGSSSSSSSSSSGGSSYSSGGSDYSSSSSSTSKNAPWVKPFSICMFLLFGVFPFLYRLGLCHGLCLGILYLFKCCIDFDDPDKEAGTPPQSEEAFFAMDIDDAAADDDIGTKERGGSPFFSGLYHGFYEQGKQRGINTRMPVQPFELFFEEVSPTPIKKGDDDDHEDTAADGRHCITGKGADLVGPYTLSGKALGNKVSMIKTYCGQGNQVTDIGHVVTMRLIRLDNQQIFDGMYYVNTDEVHTNGIYQIWPVGYDKENNVLPVPPETPIEEMPGDIENQQPEPLPEVAVAVATSISDDMDGNAPVVAIATPLPSRWGRPCK